MTLPFSTHFEISNTARDMAQEIKMEESAMCIPGQILREKINFHILKKEMNVPSTETETYLTRIKFRFPVFGRKEAIRIEGHGIGVGPRIMGELPFIR